MAPHSFAHAPPLPRSSSTRRRAARLAAVLSLCASAGCRCNKGPVAGRAPDANRAPSRDEDDFALESREGPDAAAPPRCTLGPAHAFATTVERSDAGDDRFEGVALRVGSGGEGAAWLDRRSNTLVFRRSGGAPSTVALDAGRAQSAAWVDLGESALVFSVEESRGARVQRAFIADGPALRPLAAHTGLRDDSLSLSLCPARDGALAAWDESPSEGRSVVRVQRWARSTRADPPSVVASAPEHDASDPVLAAQPDGSAILAYLALQEVPVETANQSAADIVLRALGPDGTPRAAPVTITPGPRTRFGVTILSTNAGRWVAWRLATDSDHEGLGDGGQVAFVALGEDLRPLRSAEYLSERGAVPAGRIAIVSDGALADVYWVERRGEDLVTVRRSVDARGALAGPPRDEPALAGALPFGGDARAPRVAAWGPSGEPGFALAQCPR